MSREEDIKLIKKNLLKSIKLNFKGSAGQSFGAFGIKGLKLILKGDANDYVAKGLSGATISIKLSEEKTPVNGVKGTVMASKLMGSYSFIHLSVLDENKEVIHVHSHMPANFNPKQSTAVGIEIDEEKVFVFPKK